MEEVINRQLRRQSIRSRQKSEFIFNEPALHLPGARHEGGPRLIRWMSPCTEVLCREPKVHHPAGSR